MAAAYTPFFEEEANMDQNALANYADFCVEQFADLCGTFFGAFLDATVRMDKDLESLALVEEA